MTINLRANALVTLDMAKNYLKIPLATITSDDDIKLFINAASDFLVRECQRNFITQAYTEVRSGRKNNIMLLNQWPVLTITSLKIDDSSQFTDPTTVIAATDYTIADEGNSIAMINQVFPSGYNNVQVVYSAGLGTVGGDDLPYDLIHSCLWAVAYYREMRDARNYGITQRSKGDESYQISQAAPQEVKDCISRYKRTEFPLLDSSTLNQ